MYNKDMILATINLQCKVNDMLDPKWITAGHPHQLGAVIEIGALARSAGYMGWVNDKPDKNNMLLACADILTFVLSHEIRTVYNNDCVAEVMVDSILDDDMLERECVAPMWALILDLVEDLNDFDIVIPKLQYILYVVGYSMADLLLAHRHKSMLNIHRAKYGYGVGIYTKVIDGVEDNEALRLIIENAPKDASYESHFEELVDLGYASNNTYFVKMTDYCENNSSDVTEEAVLFRRKIMDTYIELISDVLPDNTLKNTDSMFRAKFISTYTRIRSNPKLHRYQAYMDTYIYLWGLTYLCDTVQGLTVPPISTVKGAHRYDELPIDGISILTGHTDKGLTDIMFPTKE